MALSWWFSTEGWLVVIAMMAVDDAVRTNLYKRGGVFFLPLSFFQNAAQQCGGELVLKEDWSQVLFLCSDAVGFSFWLRRPGEIPRHTIASVDLEEIAQLFPELVSLWRWKHINETWDEIRSFFVGATSVSEYAQELARTYPHCFAARTTGLN